MRASIALLLTSAALGVLAERDELAAGRLPGVDPLRRALAGVLRALPVGDRVLRVDERLDHGGAPALSKPAPARTAPEVGRGSRHALPDEAGAERLRVPHPSPTVPTVTPSASIPVTAPQRVMLSDEGPPSGSEPRLVSTGKVTAVYARPSKRSRRLGYLRAGAVVSRSADPETRRGCEGGFYEIAPEGYVCAGSTASTDVEHVMARVASRRADRNAPLPYVYGITRGADAPLYTRIPSEEEQQGAEPDLTWHLAHPAGKGFEAIHAGAIPWFLEDGQPTISTHGYRLPRAQLVERRTLARSGFAFIAFFESAGRRFGLTTDMGILPVDRVDRVQGSRFHGEPLGAQLGLPVVFALGKKVAVYRGEPTGKGLAFERHLEFREAVAVTGRTAKVGKRTYLEARDGTWVRDQSLVLVAAREDLPDVAARGEKWIDVSIDRQTLVAYDGTRPVFATLVSTGSDGTGDPETTRSTVQGEFRIHTKHVSVTMDGDEVGDEYELDDVPYVQYFSGGYALHAAYWHDGFGTPRSHGCVNLSPMDARWLFGWTDPPVPTAWHGAMSVARGTLLSIHP